MKTFSQYLAEGRDAPLYHGTDPMSAADILVSDVLLDKTNHNNVSKPGVSLTRLYKTAERWPGGASIVFEIDQRLLTHKYQIRPINAHNVWAQNGMFSFNQEHSKYEDLYEEHVIGPIRPLSKYLTRISGTTYSIGRLKDVLEYRPYHHKLRVWDVTNKEWVEINE